MDLDEARAFLRDNHQAVMATFRRDGEMAVDGGYSDPRGAPDTALACEVVDLDRPLDPGELRARRRARRHSRAAAEHDSGGDSEDCDGTTKRLHGRDTAWSCRSGGCAR